eukprot:m.139594 g.139594  ORF g.139594 m.139594 type:complete len:246 (-) comp17062_c4_seq1:510-1247(-)
MVKKKKPFVNKNEAGTHSFRLVHRSQRDPLIADEHASPYVLQPVASPNKAARDEPPPPGLFADGGASASASAGHHLQQVQHADGERQVVHERKAALASAGVYFDDDYNYEQHLRPRGAPGAEVIEADDSELDSVLAAKGLTAAEARQLRDLPPDLFGTAEEDHTDVGLLNLAAPVSGPRLDWDPDIVAALDDDLDLDDPQNQLDDDFIFQAEDDDDVEDSDDGHGHGHGYDGDGGGGGDDDDGRR